MPTPNPALINGFWCSPNNRIGAWSTGTEPPTDKQINNANCITSFFENENWTLESICGILGNMQAESTINPAMIQQTNRFRLPDGGTTLDSLPNDAMKYFFHDAYPGAASGFGIGLVQWDGYSVVDNDDIQKLVAYAMRNSWNWYDGWTQCNRLKGEHNLDSTYHFFTPTTVNGVTYTFENYVTSHASPETLAEAWQRGYERNAGGLGFRGTNARYWYEFFTDPNAPPPVPIRNPLPESDTPVVENDFTFDIILMAWAANRKKGVKKPWRIL